MGSRSDWRHLFDRIANDNHSGASDLAQNCSRALVAYSEQEQPQTIQDITFALSQSSLKLLTRHPTIAGLVRILNDIFLGLAQVETARLGLVQIRRISNEHIAWVEQANSLLVERTLEILPHTGTILTISYSSAVAKSLLLARQQGYKHTVICLESRPLFEGRELANFLGKNGIKTILMTDASAVAASARANLFLVGADSLTMRGVVNKVGTRLVSLAAASYQLPCTLVSDSSKIWPEKAPFLPFAEHDPNEVWPKAPSSVNVSNIYFDETPWECFSSIITERGLTHLQQIIDNAAQIEVHQSVLNLLASIPPRIREFDST